MKLPKPQCIDSEWYRGPYRVGDNLEPLGAYDLYDQMPPRLREEYRNTPYYSSRSVLNAVLREARKPRKRKAK